MLPESEAILAADPTRTLIRKATFVGVAGGFAQVDMGSSRFICDFGAGYIPKVGETVRVWTVGDQHLIFPAGPRPGVGTVLTVTATVASVQTSTGTFSMPFAGAAPLSGDRVGVVWSEDGPWCVGKLSSTPEPPEPVPNPGGGTVRSATFMVTDTGSTDRDKPRWWQAEVWASNTTYGAWFYGTQIRDTIPAGASLVSLEFYVSWQQRQGGDPRFALHNLAAKTGVPAMQPYTGWNPGGGWQTPPMAAAWFAALKAGGTALGIGLNQGGYNRFSSRAQNAMTGALRISWRS